MARARNIKPSFFTNELLGEADPLYSLLFIGLWVLADRDGRLEDRPIRIRASVFPLRPAADVDSILTWLHDNGFIVRYEVKGKRYIQIENFVKHQQPHHKEVASTIPPIQGRAKHGSSMTQRRAKHDSSMTAKVGDVDATKVLHDPLNPDSPFPLPDSLQSDSPFLIPEPLTSERFRSTWEKWRRHRKEIKKPLTPSQEESQLTRLAGEGEQAAYERVEKSIANGWQGLWFGDEKKTPAAKPDLRQQTIDNGNAFLDMTGGAK